MKPVEFLTDVDHYNTPLGAQMEARTEKDLIITDGEHQYEVLSYYFTTKGMCLDIQRKKEK
jgi:hypothetical protein